MGILPWDLGAVFNSSSLPIQRPCNPRLTVRCEYPKTGMAPTEVTFSLSPRYSSHTGREAHEWFLKMMVENEEFEVETDRAGELPLSFWSETVRRVVAT